MHPNRIWNLIRMTAGSVLGIIGFGTLSLGFADLSGLHMALGGLEILMGTLVALGVMAPLRKRKAQP